MRFLIRAHSSDVNFNGDCDYADVTIGQELAKKILARRKILLKLMEKDSDLFKMSFWCCAATFVGGNLYDEPRFTDNEKEHIEDGLPVALGPDDKLTKLEEQRVDVDKVVLYEDEVIFEAQPKHTGVIVSTEGIPYSLIEIATFEGASFVPPGEHAPDCSSNDPSCFYQAGCDCKGKKAKKGIR